LSTTVKIFESEGISSNSAVPGIFSMRIASKTGTGVLAVGLKMSPLLKTA
jgi:hypothetical protein